MPTPNPVESQQDSTEDIELAPKKKLLTEAEKLEALKKSLSKSKSINVIATREGFFDGERKKEGDKFTLKSSDQLGTWMKPI